MLVGKHTGEAGVYVSGPVRRGDGAPLGVAVVKLDAAVVERAVADVRLGEKGGALLMDEDGVILATRFPERRFHTMRPIPPERLKEIDPERRWGITEIPTLPFATAELVRTDPDANTWRARIDDEVYYGGEADLEAVPWSVVAYEPQSQLDAPVRKLFWQQVVTILVVALFTLLFVFSHSRSILRPVRRLSDAAERLAGGDLEARAGVRSDDELGRLAKAFNSMVPKLQAGVEMKNSLRLAKEVQKNLLPDRPPEFPGIELAGHSTPADETGGDYFDFFDLRPFGDERLAIAVGDVVGHGVAAALLMATARANLRARARPLGDLQPLFEGLNRLLAEDVRQGQFMTMLFLVYDPARRTARWINAGHHPPFHLEKVRGTVSERSSRNVPLGILPEWDFEPSEEIEFGPGDVLLLGTDGVWEAVNPQGEQFGSRRVARILQENAGRSAEEILAALLGELEIFRDGVPFHDDVTVVVLRVT
jgi:sigma-B regulation protein RsbU (phosphoserine phosphatase)